MSIEAVAWALGSAPVENAQEHVILIALADCSNGYGRAAWPSVRWLALRGRCSVRTVQRHLKALEKRGVIRKGDARMVAHLPADRRPTVWDLALELRVAPTPPEEELMAPNFVGEFESQERGDNLSPATNGAPRGDISCTERGDKLSRGDTAMTPRGVTQLCHPNRHVEPSTTGGYVTGERHLSADAQANVPPLRHCSQHKHPQRDTCQECRDAIRANQAWREPRVGMEEAPSPQCPEHRGRTGTPPCGACKDARKARESWDADHARRVAEGQARERRRQARLRVEAAASCGFCDSDGYLGGGRVCSHDPDRMPKPGRGAAAMELVRSARGEAS